MLALGVRLVFVKRRPETFAAAREVRLRVSGNPGQYDDLRVFIEEQEEFHRLITESKLPAFEVDISDDDVVRVADRIADWLDNTGGLWAP